VVIQDGGSPEDLISEIEALLQTSDKLIIENDDGIFDAINRGISNCSNDYILTIGTDDFIEIQSLENIIERLATESKKVFFVSVRMVAPESLKLVRYWPIRKFSHIKILLGAQYPHFGLIAHKGIYEALKFSTTNKINSDYEFFYDLSKILIKSDIGYIQNCSVMMRLGGTSTKDFWSILSHQMIIISFAIKRNPLLLVGILFKPIYKIQELVLGILKR
jgi:glycosyltransferase